MNNDGGNPNPINPTPEDVINNAANPLANLEGVVAAAKEEAAAAKTPMEQFTGQFGSGQSTPQPEQTQPVETLAPEPEQTPAEKLKQQIADSVDAFLEEVTRDKVAA